MSDLTASFTFRLTDDDKAALNHLAARWDNQRGEVLRRLLRHAGMPLTGEGRFVTGDRTCRVRLKLDGRRRDD